jgi:hypothetical protein
MLTDRSDTLPICEITNPQDDTQPLTPESSEIFAPLTVLEV